MIPHKEAKLMKFVATPDTHLRFYAKKAIERICCVAGQKKDSIRQEFKSKALQAFIKCSGFFFLI